MSRIYPLSSLLLMSALVSLGAAAYGNQESLAVRQQNDIAFVTGGIGDEERTAMEAMRSDYNVRIMSSGKDGAFAGDTKLLIFDRTGKELVETEAGPLFYASLPAGKYIISAENEGTQQKKTIDVPRRGPSNLHFVWP